MMTEQDWNNVISVMRSAPHPNMEQAEQVAVLIEKVRQHARTELGIIDDAKPAGKDA